MNFFQSLLLFILFIQVVHFLGTWKLYIKAGRKAWEAAVPVYNAFILMKIINRPKEWYWVILLFIPIVNLIIFPVLWVETIRSFGRNQRYETILVILTLGFYIYYVNYMLDVEYVHDRSLKPRTEAGEWIASILFAVVAATLVHTYIMQPFVIPTSSLEKTLLVGDFLFVSKLHYGARTPMTPIAAPMVHDAIPLTGMKSYTKEPQLPYFRFPGFEEIERNDIVVFNWPADTLTVIENPNSKPMYKPLDKRSNYVKRCVGLPGDKLEVRDGYVYVNGIQNDLPDRAKLQFAYRVDSKGGAFSQQYLHDAYGITDDIAFQGGRTYIFPAVTDKAAAALKNHPNVASISRLELNKGQADASTFPHNENYEFNTYYFGPITIPAKGASIELNKENLPLYKRLISEYEHNDLKVSGDEIRINGEIATSYTFKQDYFWMMGDNRANSQDSRMWGFVPYDHILGKPVFIWMSWDTKGKGLNKIRWDRLFTTVSGKGEPVSYFKYFLILLVGWFVFRYFRKRKKANAKK